MIGTLYGMARQAPQLLWARSTRRPKHTREQIAATALAIADAEGIEAVTMRRIAAELGAGTMTLYHYVASKAELTALMLDAIMAEQLAPVADLRAAYQLDLDGGAVTALLGGGPDVAPDHYALADPMSLVPLGARLLLVHGARDLLVPPELSHRFAAAARAAGDDVGLIELPDADHYDMIDPESPAWPAVVQAFHAVEQP